MLSRTFIIPTEPSLASLKSHLRLTGDDLDAELNEKLQAAIRSAEATIGKVISPSVFTDTRPFRSELRLKAPVLEVIGVKLDGEELSSSNFSLKGSRLVFQAGLTGEEVEVTWKAGMEDVPPDIRAAVLMKAGRLFNNPGDTVDALVTASDNLLRPYRTYGIDEDECDDQ